MTTKIQGTAGIEFPDSTVQSSAAYTKAQSDGPIFKADLTSTSIPTGLGNPTNLPLNPKINIGNTVSGTKVTPTVAGYYQVNITVSWAANGISASNLNAVISKNGSAVEAYANATSPTPVYPAASGSSLFYMNGTTDYFEFGGMHNGAATTNGVSGSASFFLARHA